MAASPSVLEVRPGQEEFFDLPSDGLKQKTGFALDIGGSVTKIVWTSDEGSKVRLHFVSFPRDSIQDTIAFLKDKIGRKYEGLDIYTCGVGFQDYKDIIESELGIKVVTLVEHDCFVEAFHFLNETFTIKDITYPDSPHIKSNVKEVVAKYVTMFENLSTHSNDTYKKTWCLDESPQTNNERVEYPVVLCMLGSVGVCMRVESDGSYSILEGTSRCGRMFLGMGNLLTDADNYVDLIDYALKGDAQSLNVMSHHLMKGVGDDMYGKAQDAGILIYTFGHAMGADRDKFSNADKAAALLNAMCQDIAQTCHLAAMSHNIKTLIISGGFPGMSQLVRDELTRWLGLRCQINCKSTRYDYHFLKFSGYHGALGALIRKLKETPQEDVTK